MENNKIEKIEAAINSAAASEIEQLKKTSEEERAAITGAYLRKENELREEKTKEYKKHGELRYREIITESKLLHKKQYLTEKRKLIDSVIDNVIDKLRSLDAGDYIKFVTAVLRSAVITGNETLYTGKKTDIIDAKTIESLNKANSWKIKFGGADKSVKDGLLLKESNFETSIDWESIREFIKENYEDKVVKELFNA